MTMISLLIPWLLNSKISIYHLTSSIVAAWTKPDVTFGWVKLTKNSRFQPAFIYPKEKGQKKHDAQYIMTKGNVSHLKHPVEVVATPEEIERAVKSKKSSSYLKALQLFNTEHKTNF